MITVKNVADVVADVTCTEVNDIFAKKRDRVTSYARALTVHLAYDVMAIGKSRIARSLGVDHSTVIVGLKKSKDLIAKDPDCLHAEHFDKAHKLLVNRYSKDIVNRIDKLKCKELIDELALVQFALKRIMEELQTVSFIRD
jgi:hypothetical protein